MAEYNSVVCVYHISFVHPSDRHLSSFHFLQQIDLQGSLGFVDLKSSGYILESMYLEAVVLSLVVKTSHANVHRVCTSSHCYP